MTIAIDGTTLCDRSGGQGAGIEHYTWSIVFSLIRLAPQHRFVIAVPSQLSRSRAQALTDGCTNVTLIRPILPRVPFVSRHVLLPLRLRLSRPDVLFSPSGQEPLGWTGSSVITVHDAAIFEHPEWFPERSVRSFVTRRVVPRSIARADRIITVSEATKRQLERVFPAAKGKTVVVYEGVDMDQATEKQDQATDTVLFLGTVEPRKNLVNAVRAFETFLTSHPDRVATTRFVIAGKRGWKTEEIFEEIDRVNRAFPEIIRVLGYVTEDEKQSLLHQAAVVLFPSFDEGFGLPVLEAMAAGAPVIASNRGALPEVAGDAAIYVEPEDIEGMSLAIAQCILLPDAFQPLREAGLARAKQFTWEKATRETIRIIEQKEKLPT